MNKTDLYDELEKIGADYVADLEGYSRKELDDETFSILEDLPKGLFIVDRNARTVTLRPEEERDYSEITAWWRDIQKSVAETEPVAAVGDTQFCRFKIMDAMQRFGGIMTCFCIDGTVYQYTDALGTLLSGNDTVMHVGNIVDYHF